MKDVRKLIYAKLTLLERIMVEKAYGIDRTFLRYKSSMVCLLAAGRGYLNVLQWARANGCPWDSTICCSAAGMGHFDVLQWARANGCPWDENTCTFAAEKGRLEILQ